MIYHPLALPLRWRSRSLCWHPSRRRWAAPTIVSSHRLSSLSQFLPISLSSKLGSINFAVGLSRVVAD